MIYWYKTHNNNKKEQQLIFYFVLCYFLGLIFIVLRNKIPDFFSIVLSNTIFAVGSVSLYLGSKAILKLDSKWYIQHIIPIIIVFVGHFTFTYVYYNTQFRIFSYSLFASAFSFLSAHLFWKYKSKKYFLFDTISVFVFLTGALSFLLVALKVNLIDVSTYFFNNSKWIFLLPNLYLFLIVIWFVSLLLFRLKN